MYFSALKYFKGSDIANPAYDSSLWSLRPEDCCKLQDILAVFESQVR